MAVVPSQVWIEFESRPRKDGTLAARKMYAREPKNPSGLVVCINCTFPESMFHPVTAVVDIPIEAVKQPLVQVYVPSDDSDPLDIDS